MSSFGDDGVIHPVAHAFSYFAGNTGRLSVQGCSMAEGFGLSTYSNLNISIRSI
ncbi:MAG: hypothetical protein LBH18_07965 [Spirochaetaceae bacterium]|nr:hypothetical protein [Spirochaetaceae bacterium]